MMPHAILLSVLLAGTAEPAAGPVRRPNVVLVVADDLSARVLGCYGGESVETPVLDDLAAAGARFDHGYANPICMPSRYELMTGKLVTRGYVGRGNLAAGEATVASRLRAAGYATCQVGKWHLDVAGGADPGEAFFLYYAMHLPHAPYHVPPGATLPADAPRGEKYLAMVAYQDRLVGELVDRLEALRLGEHTLLLFVGDNGTPHGITYRSGGREREGGKGSLRDAGTHVPLIVNRPGRVPAGTVSDVPVDLCDFLPTILETAGPEVPGAIDGKSFAAVWDEGSDSPPREVSLKFGVRNGGKGATPIGPYWARTPRWKLSRDGALHDMAADPDEQRPITAPAGEAAAAKGRLGDALSRSGFEAVVKRSRPREEPPGRGAVRR